MDDEIQLFHWCHIAAEASAEAKSHVASVTTKVDELEATVKELKLQLDELLQAKEEDETTLLHKFRDLLNEKKVKIREQQKILSSSAFASADSRPTSRSSPQHVSEPISKPTKSRSGKRKATRKPPQSEDEDDAFGMMDVDEVKQEPLEDEDREQLRDNTTSASEAETASESEDVPLKPDSEVGKAAAKGKKPVQQPPPTRSLPFTGKKALEPATRSQPQSGLSETESDDEL